MDWFIFNPFMKINIWNSKRHGIPWAPATIEKGKVEVLP